MSMDINTKAGEKIVFANPTAGIESQRKRAKENLLIGSSYIIRKISVYGWHTDVYLEGFNRPFNSVLFDNIAKGEN